MNIVFEMVYVAGVVGGVLFLVMALGFAVEVIRKRIAENRRLRMLNLSRRSNWTQY
jgi:hypothetical protein